LGAEGGRKGGGRGQHCQLSRNKNVPPVLASCQGGPWESPPPGFLPCVDPLIQHQVCAISRIGQKWWFATSKLGCEQHCASALLCLLGHSFMEASSRTSRWGAWWWKAEFWHS
jgi:hypothetical protein